MSRVHGFKFILMYIKEFLPKTNLLIKEFEKNVTIKVIFDLKMLVFCYCKIIIKQTRLIKKH